MGCSPWGRKELDRTEHSQQGPTPNQLSQDPRRGKHLVSIHFNFHT